MKGIRREWLFNIVIAMLVFAMFSVALEYGLRAIKSLTRDGTLYLATQSINTRLHPKYGWLSPASFHFEKSDACYGQGSITYNEEGFRAPPLSQAKDADFVVCILGDSTMQGYQIPDGGHLPHLLENELGKTFKKPYVLPLAVGGYGSVQKWMLFEDYCRPLNPAVVILHWLSNDVVNNSYLAERYSGQALNSAHARPYLEDGRIVLRRPYPLRISGWFDNLLSVKLVNTFLLSRDARPPEELKRYEEMGWHVAEEVTTRLAESVDTKIVLVEVTEKRAMEMFRSQGFLVATYDPFPSEFRCLPRDGHPNTKGHQHMLNALLPVLNEALRDALSR